MEKTDINEMCFELSSNISMLGVGINSKRAAQENLSILTQACAEIGGGVRAINCLPARSMRIRQTEELIKLSTKVIFLLESGLRQDMFPAKPAMAALSAAKAIAVGLGEYVSKYCSRPIPVAMPVELPVPAGAPAAPAAVPVAPAAVPAAAVAAQESSCSAVHGAACPVSSPDGFSQIFKG